MFCKGYTLIKKERVKLCDGRQTKKLSRFRNECNETSTFITLRTELQPKSVNLLARHRREINVGGNIMIFTEGLTTIPFNFSDGNVKKYKKLMLENHPSSSYTLMDTKLVPVV